MGKIYDALERYKKEKSIDVKRLPMALTDEPVENHVEQEPIRKLIVENGLDPKLVVASAPDSLDAENFKILRSQILFPKNGKRPRTIMITSSFPGEGKTFVAANLAVSVAQSINQYVLLIDCDFRRPHLHRIMGHFNKEGLYEYLSGKRNLSELLVRTCFQKLSLLTAGGPAPNPSELLSSTQMKEFLEEVKERYEDRFIIVDAPPCQVTAETAVLSSYVDGIIFVIMAQKSPRANIQKSIQDLGKKTIGIVFNGYNQSYKSYRKYYRKYYR